MKSEGDINLRKIDLYELHEEGKIGKMEYFFRLKELEWVIE